MTPTLAVTSIAAVIFAAVMVSLLQATDRHGRVALRIRSLGEKEVERTVSSRLRDPLMPVRLLGDLLTKSKILPARTLLELDRSLTAAGFRGRGARGLFIGSKVLLLVVMPSCVFVVSQGHQLTTVFQAGLLVAAAIIGLLLPDLIVGRLRTRHLTAVESGLADALDMLVICAEAGLALEAAIERVATEIQAAHPAVAEELRLTCNEMRITSDRRVALVNLGTRTTLASLKRLGGTLIQTLQYGTPLGQALRILSIELRQETLTRFEEKAARLPVLLTMPMILFILPCVFIVVGGPAAIQISRQLIR